MDPYQQTDAGERRGILVGVVTYLIWGAMPLYWWFVPHVSAWEITIHRILWCAVMVLFMTLFRGRLSRVITIITTPSTLRLLTVTSLLISVNWTLYIWAVVNGQIIAASFGYYLTPLVSMALGIWLLKEKVSPVRAVAVGLAGVAVLGKAIESGVMPWIGVCLAISFGLYGYLRKKTPIDPVDGLLIESGLVFLPALAVLLYWMSQGASGFLHGGIVRDILLIGAGPMTAIPLMLFAVAARLCRLTTMGFLQYIGPAISLLLATYFFGEVFTWADAATFGCLWVAILMVAFEGRVRALFIRATQ